VDGKFPRGRFGLPIIFQFKEKDEKNGDPHKTILEGSEHDRFASRLIFRPIACQGGAVGLACILDGPADPPGGYVLKNQSDGNTLAHPSANLSPQEAKHIEPLNGESDVLKAFLKTLGWKE
jgi:CRISPR-associated protein Cmr1